jgi:hypothetical protein
LPEDRRAELLPFKAQMHQTVALRGSVERGLAAPQETEP